jgi:tRNA G10  N-methylase Trm11
MKKPVRREELAISPRLARILINLSGARPGKLMLDPFCGIGAVLQEALVSGINVVGLDIDKKAISDCTRNLKWLEKNYKIAEWQLLNEDSRRVPDKKYDAVAGETPLGVLVRKRPNNFEAKEIISKFEGFIVHILRRLKNVKKVDGKIAITFPFIREYSVNIDKVCNETGLKCLFRVKEYRSSQFIGREILVFA